MAGDDLNGMVPVRGVVHFFTEFGVFLDVPDTHTEWRRVFIPINCMERLRRSLEPGEMVTLKVQRRYAQQEGLVTQPSYWLDAHHPLAGSLTASSSETNARPRIK